MIKNSWLSLAFVAIALFCAGCDSVKKRAVYFYLGKLQDQKARDIKIIPPPPPYKRQSHPLLDALWWNPQSKSSVSYFSNCSKIQKSLEEFQKSAFPPSYKLLRKLKFKKGLYSVLEISPAVSNQKSYSGIWTIKQGSCYFNVNLVAYSEASWAKEESVLKNFIQGFHYK